MITKRTPLVLAVAAVWGCQPQTLADQYLSEMEEIGNTGSTVIHIEEADSYALIVGGTTSSDGVTVTPYTRSDTGWERSMMGGTSCDGPSAMLGFGAGYVYCGTLGSDDTTAEVTVAGNSATVLDLLNGDRVWFVYSDEQGEPERMN